METHRHITHQFVISLFVLLRGARARERDTDKIAWNNAIRRSVELYCTLLHINCMKRFAIPNIIVALNASIAWQEFS